MGNRILSLLQGGLTSVPGALIFKGSISVPADFPTSAEVKNGWTYRILADVTDSDGTKTNTGQSFIAGDEIAWNGTDWSELGSDALWVRSATDLSPANVGDDIDIDTGGLKDNDVTVAVALGDSGNTSFNTANKTIIGAVNETFGSLPAAVEDIFTPTLGQTVFTLSTTPSGAAAFALYLNGQLREVTTDYTQSGTTLTWLDPGGVTLKTTDLLQARYNDTAVTGVWSDDGTDLTPVSAGRNVDIDTGGLKDNDVTTAVALGDAGNTGLDSAFTATSVIGAINENKTRETFILKTFGDSPYTASAGDNAIAVNTSGGSVTIILPAASSNNGVRIRVSKATSDANLVIVDTTGGDTIGFQAQWELSHQGDSITAISDGVSEWCLFTERHAAGFEYFLPDHDGNLGNHRIQNIAGSGNANFEFRMPPDFLSIVSLIIELTPTAAGSAGPGKDIDLTSDYHGNGELFNAHTESDTTSTYDTGTQNVRTSIDISGVFTNAIANDLCGLNVDHNGVGGAIAYYGIALSYLKKG